MYKLESDFCKAFISKLNSVNLKHNRIESHGTGVGIPDMFVQGGGDDWWIELKNNRAVLINSNVELAIPWRPGQRAWHITYNLCHVKKCSWVFMACMDGVVAIRIRHDGSDVYRFTDEQWHSLNLYRFLLSHTYINR